MPTNKFTEELFAQDDALGLQKALEQWEQPNLESLLDMVDRAAGKPYTTACILRWLHAHFPVDEIEASRRMRQEKQLGLLAWEDNDWAEYFRWENVDGECRILGYSGQDEDVMIPEEIESLPVREVSKLFFLHSTVIRKLLVPEGIRVGTVLTREARELFGQQISWPEIVYLSRESPLVSDQSPVLSLPGDNICPGKVMEFGRYAYTHEGLPQPISWRVLRRLEDRALMVSDQVLERLPYHHNRSAVLWESCDLRTWLNVDFLVAAFSEEEQARLLESTQSEEPNPVFRTRNNSCSQDRVFLLSPSEWEDCKEFLQDIVVMTPWASPEKGSGSCPTWMRMPGLNAQYAVVLRTQKPDYQGTLVNDLAVGVQPAIWIKL